MVAASPYPQPLKPTQATGDAAAARSFALPSLAEDARRAFVESHLARQLDALKVLLELKADPNTKDNEGMVPLMEAARNHSPLGFELMQALVTGGASVELLVSMPPHPV